MLKHYLDGTEFSAHQTQSIISAALQLKSTPEKFTRALQGMSIVGLFEKPSLRTRVSFEIGLHRLGAQAIYLDHQNERIGVREAIKDYAQNLSVWAHGIFARVYQHQTLIELSGHARVPVVNALCEQFHPCQALADVLTLTEKFGNLRGLNVAYLGDGNNVATSLMLAVVAQGAHFLMVAPAGHQLPEMALLKAVAIAQQSGGSARQCTDPTQIGVQDALYTDTWISMGSNADKDSVYNALKNYQINDALIRASQAQAVLHCQPAHRDLEISCAVLDGKYSLILQQAENRLHAQNALWLTLFNKL